MKNRRSAVKRNPVILIVLMLVLGVWGVGEGANYYIDSTLVADCAGGAGTSYRIANRDCGGSDGTKAYNTVAEIFTTLDLAPGDTVYIRAATDGGTTYYREYVAWGANDGGTNANSMVELTAYGTDIPIISACNDFTGAASDWTDETGNVWSIAAVTEPKMALFDASVEGINDTTPDAKYDWYWLGNKFFVYSEGNPTAYYTKIEAGQRQYALSNASASWVKVSKIHFQCSNETSSGSVYMAAQTGIYVDQCNFLGTAAYLTDFASCASCQATNNTFEPTHKTSAIYWRNSDSGTISGNTIKGTYSSGIRLAASDLNTVRGNTIYNVWNGLAYGAGGAGVGILAQTSSENDKITGNHVYDCYIGLESLVSSGAGNNWWNYNIVERSRVNGIDIQGNGTTADSIFNNDVVHTPADAAGGHGIDCQVACTKVSIGNNDIYIGSSAATVQGVSISDTYAAVGLDYNNIHGVANARLGKIAANAYTTLGAWQTAVQADAKITDLAGTAGAAEAHSISSDPRMNASFILSPGSPNRDAGDSTVCATLVNATDYWGYPVCSGGNFVGFGSAIDIGANEFHWGAPSGGGFPTGGGMMLRGVGR